MCIRDSITTQRYFVVVVAPILGKLLSSDFAIFTSPGPAAMSSMTFFFRHHKDVGLLNSLARTGSSSLLDFLFQDPHGETDIVVVVVVPLPSLAKQIAFLFKWKSQLPKAIFSTQRYFA